jgi:RNA polymerase sigma-70 factor (ECF subfamily)
MDRNYFKEFKAGNQRMLEFCIQQNRASLLFFAHKFIQNETICEEIVADSFFKLWQHRIRITDLKHIQYFLFKTTKNACLNYLEKEKSSPFVCQGLEGIDQQDDRDLQFDMIYAEFIQVLYAELDRLPTQQAQIFKLSYLEGYSTEEICILLNTTANNVFYAKSKTLSHLRRRLGNKDMLLTLLFAPYLFQHF